MTYKTRQGKRKETKGKARKRTQPRRARPGYKGYVSKKAYDEAHQRGYGL